VIISPRRAKRWLTMDKEDFNKDLNDYISSKKRQQRGGIFDFLKNKNTGVKKMTEEEKKQEIEDIEDMEDEAESLEEQEEEIEEEKEGLFRRIINKLKMNKTEEIPEEEEVELAHELDEDTKKVLKMSYEWLKYMPESKLRDFKESEDFALYKEVLKKYGLAKDKKEQ
jgi:hypothetical protein